MSNTEKVSRAFNQIRGLVSPKKQSSLAAPFRILKNIIPVDEAIKLVKPTKKKTGGKITKKKK